MIIHAGPRVYVSVQSPCNMFVAKLLMRFAAASFAHQLSCTLAKYGCPPLNSGGTAPAAAFGMFGNVGDDVGNAALPERGR